MGIVRVSRSPITPEDKKLAKDLNLEHIKVKEHKSNLIKLLIISGLANIGFILTIIYILKK